MKDITGLDFEEWVYQKGLFSNSEKNKDINSLEPIEFMKALFKTIDDGWRIKGMATGP